MILMDQPPPEVLSDTVLYSYLGGAVILLLLGLLNLVLLPVMLYFVFSCFTSVVCHCCCCCCDDPENPPDPWPILDLSRRFPKGRAIYYQLNEIEGKRYLKKDLVRQPTHDELLESD